MNERRQNRRGRSSEEANAQYPGLAARSSLRQTLRFIGTLQDIHGFMQESRSRGCKRDTPFGTEQQLHSEFILKIQDRLADRRLGNVQAARCFAVVQVLSHSGKVAEMCEFHVWFTYRKICLPRVHHTISTITEIMRLKKEA